MDKNILKRALEEEHQVFDEETRRESIKTLRSWIEENSDTIKCRTDDKFLLAFLRMKKFDVTETKKMMTNFCTFIKALPKYNSNLDIFESTLDTLASSRFLYKSPFRDSMERPVFIIQLGAIDTSKMSHVDVCRLVFITLFNVLDDPVSQILGWVYVMDMSGTGPSHVTFLSPWDVITMLKFAVKAIPVRHKEIHVINMNPIIKVLFSLAQSVLPKKIKERVRVLNSLEELHSSVCPDVLPTEYGGSMPAQEMCNLWKEKMKEARDIVFSMSDMY